MFTIEQILNNALQISCLLCRGATSYRQPLCDMCLNACPDNQQACLYCGLPMMVSSVTTCGQCLNKPPVFQHCYSAFQYRFPVNHIIHRIKYSHQTTLIKPLTASLAEVLRQRYHQQSWPDAIIPVPLHKKRLQQRGYNQALLLAKALNRLLKDKKMIVDKRLVKRIRATESQQQLKASERRRNIRGAFACHQASPYQHVAIVDDVVTTGETVSELSRVLKKQGVSVVDVWCLARTPEE